MAPEDVARWVRRLRRAPLHEVTGAEPVALGLPELERLLPHRAPFLLVASIESVSLARSTLAGTLALRADDPVLAGHFPGEPVYPGVLQVEAMGQLGLCLLHFVATGAATVAPELRPRAVRATRIHHAMFLEPVSPGQRAELHAGLVEEDGLTAIAAGQVYQGGQLCALSLMEVYLVQD
jgi:3-hydroxymyristoyl/3-hydroxydecanoyl-(acyl carrier protein) dehydratase